MIKSLTLAGAALLLASPVFAQDISSNQYLATQAYYQNIGGTVDHMSCTGYTTGGQYGVTNHQKKEINVNYCTLRGTGGEGMPGTSTQLFPCNTETGEVVGITVDGEKDGELGFGRFYSHEDIASQSFNEAGQFFTVADVADRIVELTIPGDPSPDYGKNLLYVTGVGGEDSLKRQKMKYFKCTRENTTSITEPDTEFLTGKIEYTGGETDLYYFQSSKYGKVMIENNGRFAQSSYDAVRSAENKVVVLEGFVYGGSGWGNQMIVKTVTVIEKNKSDSDPKKVGIR